MKNEILYPMALVSHIVGITMLTGAIFMNWLLSRQLWKQFTVEKSRSIAIQEARWGLIPINGIGMLLLILSGVTMMAMTGGTFGEQIWFRIKFSLIVLIILSEIFIARKLNRQLKNRLKDDTTVSLEDFSGIRKRINNLYLFQLIVLLTIFTLSVFKFN